MRRRLIVASLMVVTVIVPIATGNAGRPKPLRRMSNSQDVCAAGGWHDLRDGNAGARGP